MFLGRPLLKLRDKRPPASPDSGGGDEEICFVIMPFGGWLDDYYASVYCPAIKEIKLIPRRADDLFRPSTIVNDIWAYTKRAKVLLADLTGKNPNVFYELGLAHALAKPVILVAEAMEDIPFDLRALRIILYDKNAPNWGEILRSKIASSLKEVLASPAGAVLPAFLDVKASGTRPAVSAEQKEFIELKQELDSLRRELLSRDSRRTIEIGPDEAAALIKRYVQRGFSDEMVIERVASLGASRTWAQRKIQEIKSPTAELNLKSPTAELAQGDTQKK
jgi:hypothetical protein